MTKTPLTTTFPALTAREILDRIMEIERELEEMRRETMAHILNVFLKEVRT